LAPKRHAERICSPNSLDWPNTISCLAKPSGSIDQGGRVKSGVLAAAATYRLSAVFGGIDFSFLPASMPKCNTLPTKSFMLR